MFRSLQPLTHSHPRLLAQEGKKKRADPKCIPETAIKFVKEEYCVILFGLTTPKDASVCPHQPAEHPFASG